MAILTNAFSINGLIDTSNTIMSNINELATAASCFINYDVGSGKWGVTINKTSSSVYSFTDNNIIGGINIGGMGISESYNKVSVEFPHKDLRDQVDIIEYSIPSEDRHSYELSNVLDMQLGLINEPVQAQYIANVELKQSRLDKVIEFRSDYSAMGLKGGDVIDITSEPYGFNNKLFRIIKIEEADTDDGLIEFSISALEYDDDVYDASGLIYEERNRKTQILPKINNPEITASDTASLPLGSLATATGLMTVFNALTGQWEMTQNGIPSSGIDIDFAIITWEFTDGSDLDIRSRVIYPFTGQDTVDECVGWTDHGEGNTSVWPPVPFPYQFIIWGGDNTGIGKESVLVDLTALKYYFTAGNGYVSTTATQFIVECRANWFGFPGLRPVKLSAMLYKGGTVVPDGGFSFTASGYSKARYIEGPSIYVNSTHGPTTEPDGFDGATAPGDILGYFLFDTTTQTCQFLASVTGYPLTGYDPNLGT